VTTLRVIEIPPVHYPTDTFIFYTQCFFTGVLRTVMGASNLYITLLQYMYALASIIVGFHLVSENKHYTRPVCAFLSANWYAAAFFLASQFAFPMAINMCMATLFVSICMARPGYWPLLFPRTAVTATVTITERFDFAPNWWWCVNGAVVGGPINIDLDEVEESAAADLPSTIHDAEVISFGDKNGLGITAKLTVDLKSAEWKEPDARPVVLAVDMSGSMGGNAALLGTMMNQIEAEFGGDLNPGQVKVVFFDHMIRYETDVGDPLCMLPTGIKDGGGTAYNPVENWITERFSDTGAIVYFMTDGQPNGDRGIVMPEFRRLSSRNDPKWTFRALYLGDADSPPPVLADIFTASNVFITPSVDHVKRWLVSALGRITPKIATEVTVQVLERGRPVTPAMKVKPARAGGDTVRVVVGGVPPPKSGRQTLVIRNGRDTHTVEIQSDAAPRPATDEERTILAIKVIANVQETLASGDVKKIRGGLGMINELVRTLPKNTAVEALRETVKEILRDLESSKAAASVRLQSPSFARMIEEVGDLLHFSAEKLGGRLKRVIGKALEKMASATEDTDKAARNLADVVLRLRRTLPATATVNGPVCFVTKNPITGRAALIIKTTMSNLDDLERELREGNPTSRFWLNVAAGGNGMGVDIVGVCDLEAAYAYARSAMSKTREAVIVVPIGADDVAPMLAGQILYGSPTLPANLKASQAVVFASIAAQALANAGFDQMGALKVVGADHVAAILSFCPYYRQIMGKSQRTVPPPLALVDGEKTTADQVVFRYLQAYLGGRGTLGGLVQRSVTNTADADAAPNNDNLMSDPLYVMVQLLWATLDDKGVDTFNGDVQLSLVYEVIRLAIKRKRQDTERGGGNPSDVVDKPFIECLRDCVSAFHFGDMGEPSPIRGVDAAAFRERIEQVTTEMLEVTLDSEKILEMVRWTEQTVALRGSGGGALPMVGPSALNWLIRVAQGIHASGNTHASIAANNGLPPDVVEVHPAAPAYLLCDDATPEKVFVALYHAYRGTGSDVSCHVTPEAVKKLVMDLFKSNELVAATRESVASQLRSRALRSFFTKFNDPECKQPIRIAMEFFKFFIQVGGKKEAVAVLKRLTTPTMVLALSKHQAHLAAIFKTVTQIEFAELLIPLVEVASIPVLPCIAPLLTKNEAFFAALKAVNPKFRIYVREPPRQSAPPQVGSKRFNAYFVHLLADVAGVKIEVINGKADNSMAHAIRRVFKLDSRGIGVVLTTVRSPGAIVIKPEQAAGTPFAICDETYLAGTIVSATFNTEKVELDKPNCKYKAMINPCVVVQIVFENGRKITRQPDGSFHDTHPDEPLTPVIISKAGDAQLTKAQEAQLARANALRDAALKELVKVESARSRFAPPPTDDDFDASLFY